MDLISIIVPVYKTGKYLKKCIKSLLKQTYNNIEVIIVDDGSPDESPKICDEIAKTDDRIIVIHKINGGVSSARNAGIKKARGKYIQFVDSDDFVEENYCKKMIQAISLEGSDIAICGYYHIFKDSENLILPQKDKTFDVKNLDTEIEYLYIKWLFNSPCNKIYKTNLIKKIFNEKISLGEDLEFNIDYIKNSKKITLVKNALYYYNCTEDGSLTSIVRDDFFELAKWQYFVLENFLSNYLQSSISVDFLKDVLMTTTVAGLRTSVLGNNSMQGREVFTKISRDSDFLKILFHYKPASKQHRIVKIAIQHKSYFMLKIFYKMWNFAKKG